MPDDWAVLPALAPDATADWRRADPFRDHATAGPTVGPDRVYLGTRDGTLCAQ
jgi:hypothetical protein